MPEDELNDTYDLELDADSDDDDREAAILEAMRAAEEAVEVSGRSRQQRSDRRDPTAESDGSENEALSEAGEDDGEEVALLREELSETRERALRTLADFENYRKRTEREREEVRVQAMAESLRSFLEVRDNLERALGSQASDEDLRVGVEMILRQVKEINRNFGVEEIEAMGCAFDPAVHDAVGRHEDPGVEVPMVVDELQRGYLYRGRLLRPARVMVAVPPERTASGHGSSTARHQDPDDLGNSDA